MRALAGRADFSGFATLWRSPSPSVRQWIADRFPICMNERSLVVPGSGALMAIEGLAYVLTAPGRPVVAERRVWPSPADGEALVEVIGCGLCHTDFGYAPGQVPTRKPPPLVLGHEVVGRVAEGPRKGQLLLIPAGLPCGKCAFCAAGPGNACPEQQMPGNDIDGGFATHQVVRSAPLVPLGSLPAGFEVWKLGVVADAVSTAFQAVRRGGIGKGDVAVVVGVGGVGGFTAQIAAASRAHVLPLDGKRQRIHLAPRSRREPPATRPRAPPRRLFGPRSPRPRAEGGEDRSARLSQEARRAGLPPPHLRVHRYPRGTDAGFRPA